MAPSNSGSGGKLTGKSIFVASVAGGTSGALEIIFTYPFEFAKTQVQLEPQKYKGKPFWECWKDVYVEKGRFPKGFFAIYRGMVPLILFGAPRNATRFTAFEASKQTILSYYPTMGPVGINIIAGLVGGFSEALLVTTVQETMKVRLIHDKLSPNPRFKGTFDGVRTIVKEQGLSGIYKGLGPTIIKQGSNQMIRFPVYFYLKTWLLGNPNANFRDVNGSILGNIQAMAVGGIAGAASVVGNTPIDVVKTKMQGFQSARYTSTTNCIKLTYLEEGFRGFYKGMGARMGRVSADVALTFFFVEEVTKIVKSFIS